MALVGGGGSCYSYYLMSLDVELVYPSVSFRHRYPVKESIILIAWKLKIKGVGMGDAGLVAFGYMVRC